MEKITTFQKRLLWVRKKQIVLRYMAFKLRGYTPNRVHRLRTFEFESSR